MSLFTSVTLLYLSSTVLPIFAWFVCARKSISLARKTYRKKCSETNYTFFDRKMIKISLRSCIRNIVRWVPFYQHVHPLRSLLLVDSKKHITQYGWWIMKWLLISCFRLIAYILSFWTETYNLSLKFCKMMPWNMEIWPITTYNEVDMPRTVMMSIIL